MRITNTSYLKHATFSIFRILLRTVVRESGVTAGSRGLSEHSLAVTLAMDVINFDADADHLRQ